MKLSKFIFGRKTTYLIVKQELFMIILMERVKFRRNWIFTYNIEPF